MAGSSVAEIRNGRLSSVPLLVTVQRAEAL